MAADEVGEGLDVVLRLAGCAVTALDAVQRVFMLGNQDARPRPFVLAIQYLAQAGMLGEPRRDGGQRHPPQFTDKAVRGHAGDGCKVAGGGFVQVAFFALQLGDELVAHGCAFFVARDLGQLVGQLGEAECGLTSTARMAVRSCRAS